MKPLRLQMDGLACYRQREEIDFSQLELFAIVGPTGSGKSTILDAIVFALYGEIPRIGRIGVNDMINLGRDRAVIQLEFSVGDERYRISRDMRRKGNVKIVLEQHDGEDYSKLLADKAKETKEQIEQIVGMDVDTFTKAVVLPQGEFARFLKDSPKERRQTLNALLGLNVYEKMMKAANTTAREARVSRENLTTRLEQDYQGVTPEALQGNRTEQEELQQSIAAQKKQLEANRNQITRLTQLAEATKKLAAVSVELESLQADDSGHQQRIQQRNMANAAATLMPIIDMLKQRKEERQQASEQSEDAADRVSDTGAAEKKTAEVFRQTQIDIRQIPDLRKQLHELTKLEGVQQQRDRQLAQSNTTEAELQELEKAIADNRANIEQTRLSITQIAATLARLQQQQTAINFDPKYHQRIGDSRALAQRLDTTLHNTDKLQKQHNNLQQRQRSEASKVQDATASLSAARQQHKAASEALDIAAKALSHAETHNLAATLQSQLHSGDDCPVCGQVIGELPASEVELEAIQQQHQQAEETLASAVQSIREQEQLHAKADASLSAIVDQLTTLDSSLKENQQQIEQLAADICKQVRTTENPAENLADTDTLAAWVEQQWDDGEKKRVQLSQIASQIQQQDRAHLTDQGELKTLNEKDSHLNNDATKKKSANSALKLEIEQLNQQLGDIDPTTRRAAIEQQIADLELANNDAREAATHAQKQHEIASTELTEAGKRRKRSAQALDEQQQRVDQALKESTFGDINDVAASALDPALLNEMAEKIKQFETALVSATQRRAALQQQIGDQPFDEQQYQQLQQEFGSAEKQYTDLQKRMGQLDNEIERLEVQLKKSKKLNEELTTASERQNVYQQLGQDLKSDRFQAYLLEERFQELVSGASKRLLELSSNRFALIFEDDEICVLDQDHAGESRPCKTLSGGETFIASLALALELNNQIQRAAGSIRLDSLFIDEGFGTLDTETLNVVSEAVQRLQQSGRMVGVITHVEQLKSEFENQIEVIKGTDGSRIVTHVV